MKKLYIGIITVILVAFGACETNFENPNAIIEEQILTTPEGMIGSTVGITEHFATSTLLKIVEVTGLTTREIGNTLTYMTPYELVMGGADLPTENTGTTALWERLLRDKGLAERIIDNIDEVTFDAVTYEPEQKIGIKAYAKFMRAITIGYLAQSWEQIPLLNSDDGNAKFVDRNTALAEAINLLESAIADVSATSGSAEYINDLVSDEFDFESVLNAFLARYNLFAGNYTAAISAADNVDLTSPSVWTYDGSISWNPVYSFAVFDDPDTRPTDDFGLVGKEPEPGDGRIAFYLSSSPDVGIPDNCSWPVEDLAGFFTSASDPIPVYLPGEMLLIKAEAYARNNDLTNAVIYINLVRQKTNDIFGVNANLGAWAGNPASQSEILDEIYKNRCIELFFQGLRLEDHKRFYPNYIPDVYDPPYEGNCSVERNRNYYPYPYEEKFNNSNCPPDPSI
jgi:hypothetical protein